MKVEQLEEAVDFTFDELVEELESVTQKLRNLDEARWMLERRVIEVMEADGATEAHVEAGTVVLSRPVTYDYSILAHLREITAPTDLADCYTPEHDETTRKPEKWDMTKAKKLAKLGNSHRGILDDAKIYGRPKIVVTQKSREAGNVCDS